MTVDRNSTPRVPTRLVLLSLAALWACYFMVATLRGAFLGLDLGWDIVSRRLTICVLSLFTMLAVWPLLQLLERRPPWLRLAVVVTGALPLALLLSVINNAVFAEVNARMVGPTDIASDQTSEAEAGEGRVRIERDESGNLLVDVPGVTIIKAPPAPPAPPAVPVPAVPVPAGSARAGAAPPAPPAPPVPSVSTEEGTQRIEIRTSEATTVHHRSGGTAGNVAGNMAPGKDQGWFEIVDAAFSRYFLVLAWAALYFAFAKAEEARAAEHREGEFRRAAAAAELRSLRYQVNPHFLFNTLNSLSALVLTGRHDDAERMIQTLSNFYRRTLTGDPTSDLSLADEVDLQKLYLAIEAVRFPDRLRTRFEIDPSLEKARVPGMILQPLVENSVKYAVAASQQPVTIAIVVRRTRLAGIDYLELSVSDDGPGIAGAGDKPGFGIGLGNVRDRLRARYGKDARVQFGQQDDGGFATVLTLPLESD